MKKLFFLALTVTSLTLSSSTAAFGEEFSGPFPSWRNLKTDFGAVGDGQADESAAWQRGLEQLTKHTNFCVLYVPAGIYRLTQTVKTVRKAHTDCLGVAVIGEDPARTILRWDGTNGGTMFQYDAWYSKISRLSFDGAGRAGVGLRYGPAFSTYNETSDLLFKDMATGLLFGGAKTAGQAENEVLRCQFLHCTNAGVVTWDFNSMDIWVWYSRFEDCGHALFNVSGNFHAYQNLFLRSRVADIGSKNLMVFSFVNNTSIGSRRFIDFDNGHSWGSPTTISGNYIIHPTGNFPIKLGNAGPYLVMDNTIVFPPGSTNQGLKMTWADQTLIGNRYTVTNAVQEAGRFRRVGEKTVNSSEVETNVPPVPATPLLHHGQVFELSPGADAEAIQQALDQAARLAGQKPVVHLPMGAYKISKTLTIPAGSDLQLLGDGAGETATVLRWNGPRGGAMLKIKGPSQATLADLHFQAGQAAGLLVESDDRRGDSIFADQLNASGPSGPPSTNAAVFVNGLDRTDVLFRCLQGSGNAGVWVEVCGGPARMPTPERGQISIFNGATGSANAQYNVRRGGALVVRGVYHEKSADALRGIRLADTGTLVIDTTRFSYKTSPLAPLVSAEDFQGLFTLTSSMLLPVDSTNTCRLELKGNGSRAEVLALNDQFWIAEPGVTADKIWLNRATPPARGGLLGCNVNSGTKGATPNGFGFLENRGNVDDTGLFRALIPLRQARIWLPNPAPAGRMNLCFHRVMVSSAVGSAIEFRSRVQQ